MDLLSSGCLSQKITGSVILAYLHEYTSHQPYRDSVDDGIATGLLLGPLIACALLYISLLEDTLIPTGWRIETPAELRHASAKTALIASRYSLVDLACFCSTMLLHHVAVSWWYEARYRAKQMASGASLPEGERSSVPRSEGLRSWYYVLFTLSVAAGAIVMKLAFGVLGIGIWQRKPWFPNNVLDPSLTSVGPVVQISV
jgi:hypothetical protein